MLVVECRRAGQRETHAIAIEVLVEDRHESRKLCKAIDSTARQLDSLRPGRAKLYRLLAQLEKLARYELTIRMLDAKRRAEQRRLSPGHREAHVLNLRERHVGPGFLG